MPVMTNQDELHTLMHRIASAENSRERLRACGDDPHYREASDMVRTLESPLDQRLRAADDSAPSAPCRICRYVRLRTDHARACAYRGG